MHSLNSQRKKVRVIRDVPFIGEIARNLQHFKTFWGDLTVRDPIYGVIPLPDRIRKIIDTPTYQKLRYINQLPLAYLVYPGATHSIFSHSIGRWFLTSLVLSKLKSRYFLKKEYKIKESDENYLLCSSLLCDIGHGPFSHVLEEKHGVMKEVHFRPHRERIKEVIKNSDIEKVLHAEYKIDDLDRIQRIAGVGKLEDDIDKLFYFIIHSPMGTDKLDYLLRDAYSCGVPYGYIDISRILVALELWPHKSGLKLIVNDKGIQAIESVFFSYYHMYASVYYHHAIRSAICMIKNAINAYVSASNCKIDRNYILNQWDHNLLRELYDRSEENTVSKKLAEKLLSRQLYKRAVTRTQNALSRGSEHTPNLFEEVQKMKIKYSNIKEFENGLVEEAARRMNLVSSKLEGSIIVDIPPKIEKETLSTDELFCRHRELWKDDTKAFFDPAVSQIANRLAENLPTLWKFRIFTENDKLKFIVREIIEGTYGGPLY